MIGYRQTGTRTSHVCRQVGWNDILPGSHTPKRQYDKPPLPRLPRSVCQEMEERDNAEEAKTAPVKPRKSVKRRERPAPPHLLRGYALAVWRATTADGDVRKWKCEDGRLRDYVADFGLSMSQARAVLNRLGIMPCAVGGVRYFPGDLRERIDVEYAR